MVKHHSPHILGGKMYVMITRRKSDSLIPISCMTLSGSIKHGICSSARNQGYLITLITINPIAKRKVIAYSE